MTDATHRLELTGIRKHFGSTKALDGVDLVVGPGEVHAIIGENGAGKSTLMKVLSGAHCPDAGRIQIDGEEIDLSNPRASQAAGIAMIYQELNLAPDLSVADNITLGDEPSRWGGRGGGWLDRGRQHAIAKEALKRLHCDDIDPAQPVRELSIAQQQMVEIARAVVADRKLKLLILDEPTSSLTQVDTENLFAVIERLKSEGVSVLYISHFLEECQRIGDRFTVLRDGVTAGSGSLIESDPDWMPMDSIVQMMVGREISELYPNLDHVRGEPVLRLEQVRGSRLPTDVSLTLHRGEILGLAGLIGAGRTETVRALFGLDRLASGKVIVMGRENVRRDPQQSWIRDAMGLVSEDRKNEGLFLERSLTENLTLTRTEPYRRGPFLRRSEMKKATEHWMKELAVRASDPDQAIGELSGGNQQKIALARLLHHDCEILLLDEPTRGIDIGSKRTIYQTIGELAAEGKAILLISSYLPELLGVCDSIGVIHQGRLTSIRPANEWTEHSLLTEALGAATTSE
ncbi:sugar ABC transporter ATP-binding protein [Rhodopirellula sp. P2]|uniref:sugar ABC transporter ATP-binding protein n=1 Tax=Rhodopirellula sp. P2 TaxID=2127060 RepID=UPI002368E27A|nr:sugar ABC transporter ATP-binding protein [Rhodopirellula sp. P2]WDQ17592.1 sugar ABC transporter ATP-binding protein [Rhodopirellula sp. P2]